MLAGAGRGDTRVAGEFGGGAARTVGDGPQHHGTGMAEKGGQRVGNGAEGSRGVDGGQKVIGVAEADGVGQPRLGFGRVVQRGVHRPEDRGEQAAAREMSPVLPEAMVSSRTGGFHRM